MTAKYYAKVLLRGHVSPWYQEDTIMDTNTTLDQAARSAELLAENLYALKEIEMRGETSSSLFINIIQAYDNLIADLANLEDPIKRNLDGGGYSRE